MRTVVSIRSPVLMQMAPPSLRELPVQSWSSCSIAVAAALGPTLGALADRGAVGLAGAVRQAAGLVERPLLRVDCAHVRRRWPVKNHIGNERHFVNVGGTGGQDMEDGSRSRKRH